MNQTKKKLSEAGKRGAQIKHATRYKILTELRKYVDPLLYVHLPHWPTAHLETLLKAYLYHD